MSRSGGGSAVELVGALAPAGARPALALRGCDESERPGWSRAVRVREPERQVDERGRDRAEHLLHGDGLDVLGRVVGRLDDDPAPVRAAERHLDDRSLLEPVSEVGERPREGAGGDERED